MTDKPRYPNGLREREKITKATPEQVARALAANPGPTNDPTAPRVVGGEPPKVNVSCLCGAPSVYRIENIYGIWYLCRACMPPVGQSASFGRPALPEGQEAPREEPTYDVGGLEAEPGFQAPSFAESLARVKACRALPVGGAEPDVSDGSELEHEAADALEWEAEQATREADEMAEMQCVGWEYKALRDKASDYRALVKRLRAARLTRSPRAAGEPTDWPEWLHCLASDLRHYGGNLPGSLAFDYANDALNLASHLQAAAPPPERAP